VMLCHPDRDHNSIHRKLLNETFGTKLREFKKACKTYKFFREHQLIIQHATVALDGLLPRRNLIVHGTTFDVKFGDKEAVAYRIGAARGNVEYMNQFVRKAGDVEHAFSSDQVRQASADCRMLSSRLGPIVADLLKQLVDTLNGPRLPEED
jgi:hypothetical protein